MNTKKFILVTTALIISAFSLTSIPQANALAFSYNVSSQDTLDQSTVSFSKSVTSKKNHFVQVQL